MKYLLILLLLSSRVFAAELSAEWIPPTQNVDGSPLTDLAGYNVYVGTETGVYATTIPIANPLATTATVSFTLSVVNGQPVFVAMTAIDADGNESDFSNEVVKTITVTDFPPKPPIVITVTINIGIDCQPGFSCEVN